MFDFVEMAPVECLYNAFAPTLASVSEDTELDALVSMEAFRLDVSKAFSVWSAFSSQLAKVMDRVAIGDKGEYSKWVKAHPVVLRKALSANIEQKAGLLIETPTGIKNIRSYVQAADVVFEEVDVAQLLDKAMMDIRKIIVGLSNNDQSVYGLLKAANFELSNAIKKFDKIENISEEYRVAERVAMGEVFASGKELADTHAKLMGMNEQLKKVAILQRQLKDVGENIDAVADLLNTETGKLEMNIDKKFRVDFLTYVGKLAECVTRQGNATLAIMACQHNMIVNYELIIK